MNTETIKKIAIPVAAVIASVGIGFAGVSSAQTATTAQAGTHTMIMQGERPAVVGTVTAVSGTTLTVTSNRQKDATGTTYTVNAAGAQVYKSTSGAAPVESTLSAVAVGDTVAVAGTVSGTEVTATKVISGVTRMNMGGKGRGLGQGMGTHGTISSISGTTITLTGVDGKTYTVDGSKATVARTATVTVSDLKVGDTIGVQGSVSGTTVTANHIMSGDMPRMGQKAQQ